MIDWKKVSFADIVKKISDEDRIKNAVKSFSYFPAMIGYGLGIILLLKISQIVLGWRF